MIQRTLEEQNRALFWHRRKQLGARPRQLMHETDELLFWLEECLVQEVKLVPGWLVPRIAQVITQTDRDLLEELGRERRPDRVMEVLFKAQEVLMAETVRSRTEAKVIPLFKNR